MQASSDERASNCNIVKERITEATKWCHGVWYNGMDIAK